MSVQNTQKYITGIEEEETCFHASLFPKFKPFLLA